MKAQDIPTTTLTQSAGERNRFKRLPVSQALKTEDAATQWCGGPALRQIPGCHLHSCGAPPGTTSHLSGGGGGWMALVGGDEGVCGWGGGLRGRKADCRRRAALFPPLSRDNPRCLAHCHCFPFCPAEIFPCKLISS